MRKTWMTIAALCGAMPALAQQRPVAPPKPADTSAVVPRRGGGVGGARGSGSGTGVSTPLAPGHGFGGGAPVDAPRVQGYGFGGMPSIDLLPPGDWDMHLPDLPDMSNLPDLSHLPEWSHLPDLSPLSDLAWADVMTPTGHGVGAGVSWEFQGGQLLTPRVDSSMRSMELALERLRSQELDMRLDMQTDALNRQLMQAAHNLSEGWGRGASAEYMPAPYAQGDVADSLYRSARELVNHGDWRLAAQALRALPQRYPNSVYVANALYWQAFSLYRIGGTSELREALSALEALRGRYPNAQTQADAQALAMRIQGALADRGDAQARADLARAASQNPQSCDRDQQAVQIEAMNALSRTDPNNMSTLMQKVLARKDECSVPLRRGAVFLVGNKRDAGSVALLSNVAKTDPSPDVRVAAVEWLGRIPSEDGLSTLEEITKSSDDERLQRAAVRALVAHPSARARQLVRSIVEREDVAEGLRAEALASFDKDATTADDVAWLRAEYAKLTNPRLKQRAFAAIARVGGTDVDQWLAGVVRNEDESSEIRAIALRRIGKSMSIADLGKLYDDATARLIREQLIGILGDRKEPEATDKLIDIVKKGTDPNLQKRAISALASKNDPRTTQLLLEIISK